jgi:hypothetical protein
VQRLADEPTQHDRAELAAMLRDVLRERADLAAAADQLLTTYPSITQQEWDATFGAVTGSAVIQGHDDVGQVGDRNINISAGGDVTLDRRPDDD